MLRNTKRAARTGLLLVALALVAQGCASSLRDRTQETVLAPAVVLAWPGVAEDAERGVVDGLAVGDLAAEGAAELRAGAEAFGAAVTSRDPGAVFAQRATWFGLRPWAERGVADRVADKEISSGVAVSRLERITQFDAAIAAMGE